MSILIVGGVTMPLLDNYEKQEYINGIIYDMSPSADYRHGIVNLNLYKLISNALKDSLCLVFAENLDWKFNSDKEDYVIPDVMVVCDRKQIKKGQYLGIPKFIAETLSPSTALKDKTLKKELYESKGVPEYWIIDIHSRSIEIYILINHSYKLTNNYILVDDLTDSEYNADVTITMTSFPNVTFKLSDIFDNI